MIPHLPFRGVDVDTITKLALILAACARRKALSRPSELGGRK